MLQSYLKVARLRSWLAHPQCLPAIRECKFLLDQAYGTAEAHQGPNNDDGGILVPVTAVPTPVPQDLYGLIHQHSAVLHAHIKHEGRVYSRSSTHVSNSLIMFYPEGSRMLSPVPGSIKYIYGNDGMLTFAVQRQSTLEERQQDPFSMFPHFPAKLYSSVMLDVLEVVHLSWVVSRFARWAIADDCVVVLSLCRVSPICLVCEPHLTFTLGLSIAVV